MSLLKLTVLYVSCGHCLLHRSRCVRCDMNWIHLAQDRYQWQARMNIVMNLQFP